MREGGCNKLRLKWFTITLPFTLRCDMHRSSAIPLVSCHLAVLAVGGAARRLFLIFPLLILRIPLATSPAGPSSVISDFKCAAVIFEVDAHCFRMRTLCPSDTLPFSFSCHLQIALAECNIFYGTCAPRLCNLEG